MGGAARVSSIVDGGGGWLVSCCVLLHMMG